MRTPSPLSAERVPGAGHYFSRSLLVILTLASTAGATLLFYEVTSENGVNVAEMLLVPLFAILFTRIAFSFWTATLGLVVTLAYPVPELNRSGGVSSDLAPNKRTAILMPIYNESASRVFAGVQAMRESLRAAGGGGLFDFFVLSDTTNPDIWLDEERLWSRIVTSPCDDSPCVYYRRRPRNTSRKSGNLADFCTRWGANYEYMVVLDADSVMDAETLIEMVRRMDANLRLGILQVPPTPVNRLSLFARLQQFAARVYGPIFIRGFASWAHFDSNYWGHNAIIRVAPFSRHCGLPVLPGSAPLGGEILSHDFVEAALMSRAHWKVGLAHDLGGSYEECPTTLLDYAMRDQRWCQGNMQHIRLACSEDFRPISRFHFTGGAMAYLSSPLWLLFMVLSVAAMLLDGDASHGNHWFANAGTVFALTMGMLLAPKLWSILALTKQPMWMEHYGSRSKVIGGVVIETLVSVLVAPILMLFHTRFVINTFRGKSVKWTAQNRGEGNLGLATALSVYGPMTLAGLLTGGLVALVAPELLPWFSPVLLGLLLAIPVAIALGSVRLGQWLCSRGLLVIPEETDTPDILQRQHRALVEIERAAAELDGSKLFQAVLYDPAFHAIHQNILRATDANVAASPAEIKAISAVIEREGPAAVVEEDRKKLLADGDALRELHIHLRSRLPNSADAIDTTHPVELTS